jgi:hypothetical protein
MGKIAGYPTDNDVQLSDKLIGSDVADQSGAKNLQTKNYTVGDILGVAGSTTYVPYTGATFNVDLGAFDISVTNATITGTLTDSVASAGTENQLLSVNASGFVEWKDPAAVSGVVPYTGAVQNVDLGIFGLTLADIDIGGTLTDRNDSIGTEGQVLISGNTSGVAWTSDLTLNDLDVTSDLAMSGTVTDSASAISSQGAILAGNATGGATWFTPVEVLNASSKATQLAGMFANGAVVVSLGSSLANAYVVFDGSRVTFQRSGTYFIECGVHAVADSTDPNPVTAATVALLNGALIQDAKKINTNGDNLVYHKDSYVLNVAASDYFELWCFKTNGSTFSLRSVSIGGVVSNIPAQTHINSAEVRIVKIS